MQIKPIKKDFWTNNHPQYDKIVSQIKNYKKKIIYWKREFRREVKRYETQL